MSAGDGVAGGTDARLRRSFTIGVVLCVIGLLLAAYAVHLTSAGRHRPEGVAERWLTAVSGTTRDGVEADSRRRAAALGDPGAAAPLLPRDAEGKNAFDDLEVGKAVRSPAGGVDVPFQLHAHEASGVEETRGGSIHLLPRSGGSGWRVVGVTLQSTPARVPSNGGDPPSRAPGSLWLAAVLGGTVLIVITSLLVRWAGRAQEHAQQEQEQAELDQQRRGQREPGAAIG
jgi:hypothetical protein